MAILSYTKTSTILNVQNVSLKLGNNQILRDISFQIKDIIRPELTQGQIVGLLAPSGMGKSFLLKILSGIQKPDTGTVLIGEKQEPVQVGSVGFVQQNYPLFNHRTVYGNMEAVAVQKIKDPKERKERINTLLDKFDLMKVVDLYPVQLSGGQRQRAAIVQQVLTQNNFILLDEVTSGLDYNTKQKVINIIQEVSMLDELFTTIMVSHDIESTVSVCDTLLIMGRDVDEKGNFIPGATIKYEMDLIERDLAWHKGIDKLPMFTQTVNEIKTIFPTL